MGWTEEKNAHLWYMNIHEDCGINEYGYKPHVQHISEPIGAGQESRDHSSDSTEYGSNFSVNNTHWVISLGCIFIGFIIAIIYYIIIKTCQKRNGYRNIVEIENHRKTQQMKKQNRYKVKNIMKAGLLDKEGFVCATNKSYINS